MMAWMPMPSYGYSLCSHFISGFLLDSSYSYADILEEYPDGLETIQSAFLLLSFFYHTQRSFAQSLLLCLVQLYSILMVPINMSGSMMAVCLTFKELTTFYYGSVCYLSSSPSLSSVHHSLAHWSLATGFLSLEGIFLAQQTQTFYGRLPCSF